MAPRNHIGKRIYVTAELPDTNDAAGFEALDWTRARHCQQLPQLGVSHNEIEVEDIEKGFTEILKGDARGIESQVIFWLPPEDDSGQTIVRDQSVDQEGVISIKIVRGTGEDKEPQEGDRVQYARGFVRNYQERQGTVQTSEGFEVTFRQNDFTVIAEEPAA